MTQDQFYETRLSTRERWLLRFDHFFSGWGEIGIYTGCLLANVPSAVGGNRLNLWATGWIAGILWIRLIQKVVIR